MAVTDLQIRKSQPRDRAWRLFVGQGLYVEVSPHGGKWWRFKYRHLGREKRLSFGTYPTISLQKARDLREQARKLLAAGVDPSQQRQAEKMAGAERAANTFEVVAREWFAKQKLSWVEGHASKILLRMENDLFPWLRRRPVAEITAKELLGVLNRIVNRGALETAHRVLQNCGQIFRYAIATGRAEHNPTINLLGALPPVQQKHRAAILDPVALGGLLRSIEGYEGSFVTKCALRLAPLVFVRPGELRQAEWTEIDFDARQWNLPAGKMKKRNPHIVPLAPQALDILREIHALTGRGQYVFPSARGPKRPMSNNAILSALRRMGYDKDEMSGHGFRAAARTILDETLHFRPDYIEHQLAHAVRDPDGRAYNRTAHLMERRKMMLAWADYLESLKCGGNVVPLQRAG